MTYYKLKYWGKIFLIVFKKVSFKSRTSLKNCNNFLCRTVKYHFRIINNYFLRRSVPMLNWLITIKNNSKQVWYFCMLKNKMRILLYSLSFEAIRINARVQQILCICSYTKRLLTMSREKHLSSKCLKYQTWIVWSIKISMK